MYTNVYKRKGQLAEIGRRPLLNVQTEQSWRLPFLLRPTS